MKILGQYLKDLSFENPNAPQSLGVQLGQQEVAISVNVNARTLSPTDFEVELHIEAKASQQAKAVFVAELLYAGIFRLENIPQETLHPVVLIECPRMLFPFARQILAEATRSGGFPPLYLDPIDFAGLYQKRIAQAKAQQEQAPAAAAPAAAEAAVSSVPHFAARSTGYANSLYPGCRHNDGAERLAMNLSWASLSPSVNRLGRMFGRGMARPLVGQLHGIGAPDLGENQSRLLATDELDVDLGQKLGIRAALHACRACVLSMS